MKKSELVSALAEETGQSKATVGAVLDALPKVVVKGLASGPVTLPGIAKIDVRHRPERTVRNPATGTTMRAPATTVPAIKPVKALKDAVAGISR